MSPKTFLNKYKIPIASVLICVIAFLILSTNSDSFTGNFFSYEPTITDHGKVLIYEAGGNDNGEKTYSLINYGEDSLDVLVSAKAVGASVRIFLPEIGWLNLPADNSSLCIADNMPPNSTLEGYKLEMKGNSSAGILRSILLTSYDSNTVNPCKEAGEYIIGNR
jgi:hypothetical protein